MTVIKTIVRLGGMFTGERKRMMGGQHRIVGRIALVILLVFVCVSLALAENATEAITAQDLNETHQLKPTTTTTTIQLIQDNKYVKTTDADLANNSQLAYRLARLDLRRPIWVLAHMVNSIKELEYRLARGANAIEADVTFGRDGSPLYTYHGPPCDCWRHCYQQEDFKEYISYIREIAIDQPNGIGQNLSLLFLDLKLDSLDQRAKAHSGRELAEILLTRFFVDAKTTNLDKINNSSHLMSRIGFDVGMNDDLQAIEQMWRRFGPNNLNLWQGDGYTNCLSPFYNLERLTKALGKRNLESGFPAKVYHWTIDLHDRMRESLRLNVDAIMTNHPERVLGILQEPEMAHNYRLATREDNPFKKLTRDSVGRSSGETARYQRSASATSGGLVASLLDVFSSWLSYVREIPLFSLPTTIISSSRSSAKSQRVVQKQQTNQPANGKELTIVKLQNQSPEYTFDSAASSRQETTTNETMRDSEVDLQETPAYEGPKWYTTLVSNMLVSALRVFLPT